MTDKLFLLTAESLWSEFSALNVWIPVFACLRSSRPRKRSLLERAQVKCLDILLMSFN